MKFLNLILNNLIWFLVLIAFIFFSVASDRFLHPVTISNILISIAALGFLVLSQSYTFITGNFDLSVESTLAFTAMVAALFVVSAEDGGLGTRLHYVWAILIMLLIGTKIGLFNGFLITRLKVNNLIVTIAMLFLLRGLTYGISPGTTVSFFPEGFRWLGNDSLLKLTIEGFRGKLAIPVSGIMVIIAFLFAYIHTKYTQFGRNMYAIGSDKEIARNNGINVDRTVIIVYMIAGFCAAIAGLIIAGRLNSATPTMGHGIIFTVHAAAIIGGMSIYGGRGNVIGAFGGVLLWAILDTGLNIMRVSPFWIEVSRGLLLLLAVLIEALRNKYQQRIILINKFSKSKVGEDDQLYWKFS
jgi:ribose/xylose/arabinose/galactoside ABC-type transport system permease subunit